MTPHDIEWYSNIELKRWLNQIRYIAPNNTLVEGVPFTYEQIQRELALRQFNLYESQKEDE